MIGKSTPFTMIGKSTPFTMIEAVPNLKDRELTLITVEVNALGNLEEGNMAVVRATSLVPSLKQSVSGLVRTIMIWQFLVIGCLRGVNGFYFLLVMVASASLLVSC
ncbi:hypothetical protein ACOMHN_000014 [Nucella lapillus]